MKGRLYVVMGLSGAGKDTVAKLIEEYTSVTNVKFADLMKWTFAEWYDVDYEQFNDQQRRLELVPGTDFTYADVMIRAYHVWKDIDPLLTVRPTRKHITNLLDVGWNVVLTDVRNEEEANVICDLLQEDYAAHVIHVFGRVGETRKSPDLLLERLISRMTLAGAKKFSLYNGDDLDYLRLQLESFDIW